METIHAIANSDILARVGLKPGDGLARSLSGEMVNVKNHHRVTIKEGSRMQLVRENGIWWVLGASVD